jgi:GNAT superfamily N-acetyltransferase
MNITLADDKKLDAAQTIALYKANGWSSADKPNELIRALSNSHSLITAYDGRKLVGLGNALSDGFLFVYYPHLVILPEYQGKGIGKLIMIKMQERYHHLHMQMLTADEKSISFYRKLGFRKAGNMEPMWIYQGNEH